MSKFEVVEGESSDPKSGDFYEFQVKQHNKPRGNQVAAITTQDHGIDDLQKITRKSVIKIKI